MTTKSKRLEGRQVQQEAGLQWWTQPEPEQERVGKATRKRKKKVKR